MSAVEAEEVDTVPGVGKEHWAEGGAVARPETETSASDASVESLMHLTRPETETAASDA